MAVGIIGDDTDAFADIRFGQGEGFTGGEKIGLAIVPGVDEAAEAIRILDLVDDGQGFALAEGSGGEERAARGIVGIGD